MTHCGSFQPAPFCDSVIPRKVKIELHQKGLSLFGQNIAMKVHTSKTQKRETVDEETSMMSKGFTEGKNSVGIVLSYKTCLRACYQRHGSVPTEGMFLFSTGKAMTACLRDYVSRGKMKPCMEVMSYMRSQGHFLGPCQPSEVC